MQVLARGLSAAVLLCAGTAYADDIPVYEGTGFTLTRNELDPVVEIGVLSEAPGSTTFWLLGMEPHLAASADSSYQQYAYDYQSFEAYYGLAVKSGYRITGITVSGNFTGALHPAEWTMPGDASNALGFSVHAGGTYFDSASTTDLDGTQGFTVTTGRAALQGQTWVALHGSADVGAESVFYHDDMTNEDYWLGSQAAGSIGWLRMTVDVSPVPEPGTWAMWALGLACVAGVTAARCDRRVAAGGNHA
jgi:hypothetical protein